MADGKELLEVLYPKIHVIGREDYFDAKTSDVPDPMEEGEILPDFIYVPFNTKSGLHTKMYIGKFGIDAFNATKNQYSVYGKANMNDSPKWHILKNSFEEEHKNYTYPLQTLDTNMKNIINHYAFQLWGVARKELIFPACAKISDLCDPIGEGYAVNPYSASNYNNFIDCRSFEVRIKYTNNGKDYIMRVFVQDIIDISNEE